MHELRTNVLLNGDTLSMIVCEENEKYCCDDNVASGDDVLKPPFIYNKVQEPLMIAQIGIFERSDY